VTRIIHRIRARPRAAIGMLALAVAVVLAVVVGRLSSSPAYHAQLDRFWLGLSGASETRQLVAEAHQRYNELVWADAPPSARHAACEKMTEAAETAHDEHRDETVAREVSSVRDIVCKHAEQHTSTHGNYSLDLPIHDTIAGHETWIQGNS
jgi:hypothetical protein